MEGLQLDTPIFHGSLKTFATSFKDTKSSVDAVSSNAFHEGSVCLPRLNIIKDGLEIKPTRPQRVSLSHFSMDLSGRHHLVCGLDDERRQIRNDR